MLLYVAAQFGIGFACLVLRGKWGMFKALDLEKFIHGIVSVNLFLMSIGSKRVLSFMFGMEPSHVWALGDLQGDALRFYFVCNCILLFLCLLVRVRAFLALTLPLVAVGPEIPLWLAHGTRLPGPAPADVILCGVSTALVLYCALEVERAARAEWRSAAQRREASLHSVKATKALLSSMEAAIQTNCHMVTGLDSQSRVLRPHPEIAAFFGVAVAGTTFAELLCDDSRPAFEDFIDGSSSGTQRCLPVTLKHGALASTCRATLLMMCAGDTAPAHYLVGIKLQDTSWSVPRTAERSDLADNIPNMMPIMPSWSHQPLERDPRGSDFGAIWTESVEVGTSEPGFVETGTQVDAVFHADPTPTSDKCGNTDLTWYDYDFVCRTCAYRQLLEPPPDDEDNAPRTSFNWEAAPCGQKNSDMPVRASEAAPFRPAAEESPSCLTTTHVEKRKRKRGQETVSDPVQPHTGWINDMHGSTRSSINSSSSSSACNPAEYDSTPGRARQPRRSSTSSSSSSSACNPAEYDSTPGRAQQPPRSYASSSSSSSAYNPADNDRDSAGESCGSTIATDLRVEEIEPCLDGEWVVRGRTSSLSQWLQRLTIQGGLCIDGNDEVHVLVNENGRTYLLGGRLILEEDVLFRVGRSKRGVAFVRQHPALE